MASASTPRAGFLGSAQRAGELILPIGVVASVLVIMVPMPAALMDLRSTTGAYFFATGSMSAAFPTKSESTGQPPP